MPDGELSDPYRLAPEEQLGISPWTGADLDLEVAQAPLRQRARTGRLDCKLCPGQYHDIEDCPINQATRCYKCAQMRSSTWLTRRAAASSA